MCSWTLRFQKPSNQDLPSIARFTEKVDWNLVQSSTTSSTEAAASKPCYFYYQEEELKEDETDKDVVKDEEYYRKRRKQMRRFYRTKQQLIFENRTNRQYFEGKQCNLDLSSEYLPEALNKDKDETTNMRYVLLKFQKKELPDGKVEPEILVTPVSSMYLMHKTGRFEDNLLEEVEEKYVKEKMVLNKQLSKFKAIVNAFHSGTDQNAKANSTGGEYVDEINETDVFRSALNKAFPNAKGSAAPAAKSSRKEQNSTEEVSHHEPASSLNEVGIDMDQLKEYDWCQGDYEKTYADDEEQHITLEQTTVNQIEEKEISSSWRNDEHGSSSDDEDDEDTDDEGQAKPENEKKEVSTGLVNQKTLEEAKSITAQLAATGQNRPSKHSIESGLQDNSSEKRRKITFANDVKESNIESVEYLQTSSKLKEYELSESGVQEYIRNRGGRVSSKHLYEAFKSVIKAYGKEKNNKLAAMKRFNDIIDKVAATYEDATQGVCLKLKV